MKRIRCVFEHKAVKSWLKVLAFVGGLLAFELAFATAKSSAGGADTIGAVAEQITTSFEALAKLITAGAYIAGLGFAVGSVMKFKQHKDNPTQIPVGTPVALLFIAAALIFLPTIFRVTGYTLFKSGGTTGGPDGVAWEHGSGGGKKKS